jgi:SAM-dependent methyltransferase
MQDLTPNLRFRASADISDLIDPEVLQREISEVLGTPLGAVRETWAAEAAQLGSVVLRDARQFGITPHQYDAAMERLYREGAGFVYETLCYWRTPDRMDWSTRGLQRVLRHARAAGVAPGQLRVLVLGDGAGTDTLFLARHGIRPTYFDVPGSVTWTFARDRFAHRRVAIEIVEEYASLLHAEYDVVWCYDAVEHLPDLPTGLREIGLMVKPGGILLLTESCIFVRDDLPTHLEVNRHYGPRIPGWLREHGLHAVWLQRHTALRPVEYQKLRWWDAAGRVRSWSTARRLERELARISGAGGNPAAG